METLPLARSMGRSTFTSTSSYSYTDHRKTSLLVSQQHQFSHHSGDSYLKHFSCCWWQGFQTLLDIRYLCFDLENPKRHDRLRPPMAASSRGCCVVPLYCQWNARRVDIVNSVAAGSSAVTLCFTGSQKYILRVLSKVQQETRIFIVSPAFPRSLPLCKSRNELCFGHKVSRNIE
jgi:hypothetical protein